MRLLQINTSRVLRQFGFGCIVVIRNRWNQRPINRDCPTNAKNFIHHGFLAGVSVAFGRCSDYQWQVADL